MDEYENVLVERDGICYAQVNKEKVMQFMKHLYAIPIDDVMYITKLDAIAAYTYILVQNTYGEMPKQKLLDAISETWDMRENEASKE